MSHEGSSACDAWQSLATQELFLHTVFFRFGETAVEPHVPEAVCESYAPPLPWGWPSYTAARALPVAEMNPSHVQFTQDALSKPLTMLYALSHVMSVEEIGSLRSLTVHVLGAGAWDVSHGTMDALEELLHMLPKLQHLRVAFVGPALPAVPGVEEGAASAGVATTRAEGGAGAGAGTAAAPAAPAAAVPPRWSSLRMEYCEDCTARRRVCDVVLARCLYQDFLSVLEDAHGSAAFEAPLSLEESLGSEASHRAPPLGRPDLVVAFNAGIAADEAKWSPALRRVLTAGWPLALTFDSESSAPHDIAALHRVSATCTHTVAKTVLPPQPCPFASPIVRVDPLPDDPQLCAATAAATGSGAEPELFRGDAVCQPNGWVCIVRGEADDVL